ncbi:PIR Superfamily Protein [Plasmodium ovale wallikeri]|uniref:PIR Superfamily Protein n=1 Tax=Plasmodium ovale wallikeri TaxID=864142 RepID=A0A1A9AJK7_PLAOA|nr:PIR Superfamily Protein [Plasmodium ovale wallikeri]SBT56367.1 PIR Superfamily Protein [Plasmodium ovale wallikeri]
MRSTESDKYTFLKDLQSYERYAHEIEKSFTAGKPNTACNSFFPDVKISSTEFAKDICEKLKDIHGLISRTKIKTPNTLNDNDFAYLNYWLNGKLRGNTINHGISVDTFQDNLNTKEKQFFTNNKLEGKLYDIEENDFKNMNLLSNLQINYSNIYKNITIRKEDEKISCLKYCKEFIDTYKKGIIKCPLDDSNFCNILKDYKKKYQGISSPEIIEKKCIDMEHLQLPTYEDVLIEYVTLYQRGGENSIVSGTILVPTFAALFILVFLYAFTPIGQWIRAKIGKNKITHSNLYEKNNQLLLDTSDNEYINSTHNPYSISYDSAVNS